MLEVRGRPIEFWVTDNTNEDMVEDLLTRPVPPSGPVAPPASGVPLAPTALFALTTAPTRRDDLLYQPASETLSRPYMMLESMVSNECVASLVSGEDELAVAGKDEDEIPHKRLRRGP
ncbi:MAG: hypothetical protein Q9180_004004 [Flavoplaca navasiana]